MLLAFLCGAITQPLARADGLIGGPVGACSHGCTPPVTLYDIPISAPNDISISELR
jgi:hypothetical protein